MLGPPVGAGGDVLNISSPSTNLFPSIFALYTTPTLSVVVPLVNDR